MKSDLREIASQARIQAYAPYSHFLVGAALRSVSGAVFSGCNIENTSLGLTICAERVCLGNALVQGERAFEEITIVADSDTPVMPCGACRQVLAEFSPALTVVTWTVSGESRRFTLSELLPMPTRGILPVPRGT